MAKTLVIGFGVSGKAAVQFLRHAGREVIAVDRKGGEGVLLDTPDVPLEGVEQVILSPGVPQTHPLVQKALAAQIEVIGEMELGFRHLKNRSFGITGSNGKTTTVLLTTHILNASGRKAQALGNVGQGLTTALIQPDPEEIFIIELSSFQLETLFTKKLEVGLVLNLTANHLDRHGSMEAYAKAKAGIGRVSGTVFVSNQILREFGELFPGAESYEKEIAPIDTLAYTELEMPSKQSIQASYLLCKRCGVTDFEFLHHLKTFKKPAHRIEGVAEINGVSYYNDSKSSNIDSVLHAVSRLPGPIVLIVGGVHKGSSYRPWVEGFKGKVRAVIAYGQAAPLIEQDLSSHLPFVCKEVFADAVRFAKQEAKASEIVLLSPGCSSYDQFENYEQRGDAFKRLVREA